MRPPAKQDNYAKALRRAFERLRAAPPESLATLGARPLEGGRYELPVFDARFVLDPEKETCTLASGGRGGPGGGAVRMEWRILAASYLGAEGPPRRFSRWVGFAELEPAARVYDRVHRGRVVGRLVGTVGGTREAFVEACHAAGGEPVDGLGDAGFRFQVFPEVALQVAWHGGDEDLPPSASVLYPDNVTSFFSVESTVVLAERLVSRLSGASW